MYIAHKEIAKWVIDLACGSIPIDLIIGNHYQKALEASTFIFDDERSFDAEMLLLSFECDPKRFFEISKNKAKTYGDLLQTILDSKAENLGTPCVINGRTNTIREGKKISSL